jgi:hypothetical protein
MGIGNYEFLDGVPRDHWLSFDFPVKHETRYHPQGAGRATPPKTRGSITRDEYMVGTFGSDWQHSRCIARKRQRYARSHR